MRSSGIVLLLLMLIYIPVLNAQSIVAPVGQVEEPIVSGYPDSPLSTETMSKSRTGLESLPPLTGTRTIGGGGDFATFTLAAQALVDSGVGAGGVTFLVTPGSYAERFSVNPVTGASAANLVTFVNNGGVVTVNGTGAAATTDPMITLNGCDYIIFDGINVSDGGTTAADQVEYGFLLRTLGNLGADGATNNIIRNCAIQLGGGGTVAGFSHGVLISNLTTATAANHNNAIRNITVDRSDRGVGQFGQNNAGVITVPDTNIEVSGCVLGATISLGNALTGTTGSAIGIILSASKSIKVFNNHVRALRATNTAYTGAATGIVTQNTSGMVYNNRVSEVFHANATSITPRSIGVQTGAIGGGTMTYYNNFISGITSGYVGAASATVNTFGFRSTNFAGGGGASEYYHNTVLIFDPLLAVPYSSAAFGSFAGAVPMETINNILVNVNSASAPPAAHMAIWDANAAAGFLTSDNNDLSGSPLGLNGTATYSPDLATWQSNNPGLDGSSTDEIPNFVDPSVIPYNLHIDTGFPTALDGGATPIAGITTDYDGDTRDALTPDMGADEFTVPVAKDIRVLAVAPTPSYPSLGSTISIQATIVNQGTEPNPAIVPITYKAGSAPTSSGDGTAESFSPSWVGNSATVTFAVPYPTTVPKHLSIYAKAFYPGDLVAGNDVSSGSVYVLPDTDYVVLELGQINGIYIPFGPAISQAPGTLTLPKGVKGTPASLVGTNSPVDPASVIVPQTSLGVSFADRHFDDAHSPLGVMEGNGSIDMQTWVQNLGYTSSPYTLEWSVGSTIKVPVGRPGLAAPGIDTVDLNGIPAERGTLSTIANVVVNGDSFPSDNSMTFDRTLVYPSPNVRLRYDNGTTTVSTNIGYGGGLAMTAGVRFTASEAMKLANVDAIYRTEGSSDSIWVNVRAAGANDSTPGPIVYSRKFAGSNYLSFNNDYFTLPLGDDAPTFSTGESFWVTLTFPDTNITFPAAAQSNGIVPPITTGRSFFSGDSGVTWFRLVLSAIERAWMLRVVGIPVNVTTNVATGWNLVSNPVTTSSDSMTQLFPTSLFAYGFRFDPGTGYQQAYELTNGIGYWAKFPGAAAVTFSGAPRTSDSVNVVAGWNLLGSISVPVDTGDVTTNPPGIQASAIFGYPYSPLPSAVMPGKGYWMKANAPGKVYLEESPAPAGRPHTANPLEELNTLTITDATGTGQTLYFGADARGVIPASRYEMPPSPPAGVFDARFENAQGGFMVQTHALGAETAEFPVAIQSAVYPLTITWNVKGGAAYEMTDAAGNRRSVSGEGSAVVSQSSVTRIQLRLTSGSGVPAEFALLQNYPNPFNPSTNLKFSLPVASRVNVEIYNVLGQRVRSLLSDVLPAGYHVVEWDGRGNSSQVLGSGVYFVKFTATGNREAAFTDVRKIMMMK
ncbi:MAG: FlgD immunoglobulin-like domain containing protein [Bacteroidota bacterium]